jgi:hypothetical protein
MKFWSDTRRPILRRWPPDKNRGDRFAASAVLCARDRSGLGARRKQARRLATQIAAKQRSADILEPETYVVELMLPPTCLDVLEPPAWGPAPAAATFLAARCHALRRTSLDQFTVEDLRLMIGQQIGLLHLMPLALEQLAIDPLVGGDYFPGDLLESVLRVDRVFWERQTALASSLSAVIASLDEELTNMQSPLGELIREFQRVL